MHLVVELLPFTGPLAHTSEDARPLVLQRDVVDQLGDDDCLAHARAAEEADLTAPQDRAEEVYDLDAGYELLGLGGETRKIR